MRTCVALRGVAAAAVWVVSCAGASAGSDIAVIPGIGPPVAAPSPQRIRGTGLGGGFLEFVATGHSGVIYNNPDGNMPEYAAPLLQPARTHAYAMVEPRPLIGDVPEVQGSVRSEFMRREISYGGAEQPGTVVVDTPHKYLYFVLPGGRAIRYGVGVGRPGFEWAGSKTISHKAEWPDWTPPAEMMLRRPDLPSHMAGGPGNPLGARAMYLGSSLYRIHGTNEPDTIGRNVSSGCIRMMNPDVIDLYGRVRVGTHVIVL